MAQRAHRSFGQVYADQETIKESEKRTPLISPENARKLSEKKRKYVKRRKKLQTEENDQLWKKWRNIATSIRRKAIKQYWTQRDLMNLGPIPTHLLQNIHAISER